MHGKGDNPNVSPTTGWAYNDPDNGGFEVIVGAEQETGPGLVLIEGGTFTMGRIQEDVMYDWNNAIRRVTVSSFTWMKLRSGILITGCTYGG